MSTATKHPKYQIPEEPHAKHRYESALKHVQFAREAGKTSEEIHEIFHKVMNFNSKTSKIFLKMRHTKNTVPL